MSGDKDLVERLRLLAAMYPLWGEVKTRSNQAADEIERLRAAGDELAVRYRKTFGLDGMFDAELRQWEAARRG